MTPRIIQPLAESYPPKRRGFKPSNTDELSKENLQIIPIVLPSCEKEQKSIVEILQPMDDKIDLLQRQNKTLETLAETLFRQWFIEEASEDRILEDIIIFNPNLALKKSTVATYLEMSNISNNNCYPKNWYKREFNSGMRFQNDDTLLARITPCLENGKTCFVSFLDDNEIGWGSTEFIVLRMKEGYHPYTAYIIAKNKDFRQFAISNMSGYSGRQRVQASNLKEYDIKIPSVNIIEKFNIILDKIVPKIISNFNQIYLLENLRDSLLSKLCTQIAVLI